MGLRRTNATPIKSARAFFPRRNFRGEFLEFGQADKQNCKDTIGLLKRAHVIAGELRFIGKETDRKWEEGDEISVLEFTTTEYGRATKVVASDEVKNDIRNIGINKCARESGFDRKNFIRKLVRSLPVKRNSYNEFVRWLQVYKLQNQIQMPGPKTIPREVNE